MGDTRPVDLFFNGAVGGLNLVGPDRLTFHAVQHDVLGVGVAAQGTIHDRADQHFGVGHRLITVLVLGSGDFGDDLLEEGVDLYFVGFQSFSVRNRSGLSFSSPLAVPMVSGSK